jgi:hypothetical protein
MDKALAAAPWLVTVAFGVWNGWLTWQWEGRLVERGTLPERRFLVRRGPESYRLPWQSWQKKWGLAAVDSDPEVERLRQRVLLSSKLTDAALVTTLATWAYLGLRG